MFKVVNLKSFSSILTIAFVTATTPSMSQIPADPVNCQTVVSLNQGTTLTYQVIGSLPKTSATEIPQNPIGTTLTLTVQRRDRSGRIETLLKDSALSEYEQMAPDADYSKLPFEETFRAEPNNGDRLYGTPASVHGLFISLRPTNGQPQQMQSVHYLSADQYLRSATGTCQK